MAIWEKFEMECANFLNNKFGNYAEFTHQGGADSTVPDIFVKTNSGDTFYIEVKHSPAQCGQFVLLPQLDTKTFTYSDLNINKINNDAKIIMNYMNSDFDSFREAGTAGKDICIADSQDIFSSWITQTYKNKNVKFFISNDFKIIPIESFSAYFNISGKYRIKRSGSRDVGTNNTKSIINYINSRYDSIDSFYSESGKLFVYSSKNLHNIRFIIDNNEYMFSSRDDKYEIRKLSNTYNANVIFSITLNESKNGLSDKEFIDCLK